MIKLENIKYISRVDDKYVIELLCNRAIKLKSKRVILPLLFLINYSSCTLDDIQSDKYDDIYSIIHDKVEDLSILKNDLKDKYKPFSELISDEHFYFIKKEIRDKKVYYVLNPKDHKYLFADKIYNDIDISDNITNKIYIEQNKVCNMCFNPISKDEIVLDYIKPLLRGGNRDYDNIQILCKSCYLNKRKMCKNCIDVCTKTSCPMSRLNIENANQIYISSLNAKIKANKE